MARDIPPGKGLLEQIRDLYQEEDMPEVKRHGNIFEFRDRESVFYCGPELAAEIESFLEAESERDQGKTTGVPRGFTLSKAQLKRLDLTSTYFDFLKPESLRAIEKFREQVKAERNNRVLEYPVLPKDAFKKDKS